MDKGKYVGFFGFVVKIIGIEQGNDVSVLEEGNPVTKGVAKNPPSLTKILIKYFILIKFLPIYQLLYRKYPCVIFLYLW